MGISKTLLQMVKLDFQMVTVVVQMEIQADQKVKQGILVLMERWDFLLGREVVQMEILAVLMEKQKILAQMET